MVDESKYEVAMQIIAAAGASKSCALGAVDAAAEGIFDEADSLIAQAREQMLEAHNAQFEMMTKEASGTPIEVNIILVHAEDHLSMAIESIDLGERMIELYKRLAGKSTGATSDE